MSILNVRIEEKTKKEAAKTLEALGLDLSTAVKMFLNQVVIEQGIPFKPSRRPADIKVEWDREVAETMATGTPFRSADEVFASLGK